MLQKADGSATFVAIFGVEEHAEEDPSLPIADECQSHREGLQWAAVPSLEDEFERDSVYRLLQRRVMPRSVLVHDMSYYPQLPSSCTVP
jgi:hypothetical protein